MHTHINIHTLQWAYEYRPKFVTLSQYSKWQQSCKSSYDIHSEKVFQLCCGQEASATKRSTTSITTTILNWFECSKIKNQRQTKKKKQKFIEKPSNTFACKIFISAIICELRSRQSVVTHFGCISFINYSCQPKKKCSYSRKITNSWKCGSVVEKMLKIQRIK